MSLPTGARPRSSLGRRLLARARTTILVVVLGVFALMDLIYSPVARGWMAEDTDTVAGWKVGVMFVLLLAGMCHGLLVLPRARRPRAALVTTTASALLLPFSPVAALVVLSSHLAHRRLERPVLACAAVGVATVVCTWRDLLGGTRWESWVRVLLADTTSDHAPAPVPWPAVAVFVALVIASAIGLGLLRRYRADTRGAEAIAETALRSRDDAVETVSRQAEREQVGREIHDGIGHRLSLLSLEAGALQLEAADDPRLAESAARLRTQASVATDELRTLVGMLREPTPDPVVTLDELQDVLDESADAGQLLSATVNVDAGASAPAPLARAVHRITTEIMTNARRHAPQETLRLRVTGGPGRGIDIAAANRLPRADGASRNDGAWTRPLPGGGPGTTTGGSGLVGIVERAEIFGGHARHGVHGDRFRVDVHLPWPGGVGTGS